MDILIKRDSRGSKFAGTVCMCVQIYTFPYTNWLLLEPPASGKMSALLGKGFGQIRLQTRDRAPFSGSLVLLRPHKTGSWIVRQML